MKPPRFPTAAALLWAVVLPATVLPAVVLPAAAKPDQTCLTPAESREAVAQHNLARPGKAQREAAAHAQAEPLRSRLCRWNTEFVYDITLLRRDGKVTHVFVKAADGMIVNTAGE